MLLRRARRDLRSAVSSRCVNGLARSAARLLARAPPEKFLAFEAPNHVFLSKFVHLTLTRTTHMLTKSHTFTNTVIQDHIFVRRGERPQLPRRRRMHRPVHRLDHARQVLPGRVARNRRGAPHARHDPQWRATGCSRRWTARSSVELIVYTLPAW